MENTQESENLTSIVSQLQQCNSMTQTLVDRLRDIANQLYSVLGAKVVYCILREVNSDAEHLHKKITDYLAEMERLIELYRIDENNIIAE